MSWSPDGRRLASGSVDNTVRIWDAQTAQALNTLEGHSNWVTSVSWSPDGRRLASGSSDSAVRIWDAQTRDSISTYRYAHPAYDVVALVFVPYDWPIRTYGTTSLGDSDIIVENVPLPGDIDTAIQNARATSVRRISAKLMLMGESNAGKSALALRLTEDRFEPQTSTHAMRLWQVPPEQIHADMAAPQNETRELVIWDLGGQQEYQLVHQLFLQDTHLAMLLLDPTRDSEFNNLDAWCLKLKKQRGEKEMKRLLVGAKSDEIDSGMIDASRVEATVKKWEMAGFHLTSAANGDGIDKLREAIAAEIDWDRLSKTTRPLLFQQIRDLVDEKRKDKVVVLYSDLEKEASVRFPEEFDPAAVNTVIAQLAGQGALVDTRLSTGERALVLRIGVVEQYAGSLVRLARDRSRSLGVPALDLSEAICCTSMPGMDASDRLPPLEERSVLECVVELMIDRGLCLEQNRRLVFPRLFPDGASDDALENGEHVSLYYDFSGAIDNIYASLTAELAVGQRFGRVRLWPKRAVFDRPGQGLCGLRRVDRQKGWAHLDLVFGPDVSGETRNLFTLFVEEHLREQGVTIREVLDLQCANGACTYRFEEAVVRTLIDRGDNDTVCPLCKSPTTISKDAASIRKQSTGAIVEIVALKKTVEKNKKHDIREAKQAMGDALIKEEAAQKQTQAPPTRILHLSDLHFAKEDDPIRRLQPLLADLRDTEEGLGDMSVDFLAITGDLTNRASPEEFEKVHQFLSALLERLKLTASRCVIMPGNHDLSWEEVVYEWKPKRKVDESKLKPATFVPQGDGYLVRIEDAYPNRFKNFGKFYHELMQRPYPLKPEQQFESMLFESHRLQFLSLNSAWEIDEYHKERSSIHENMLSSALIKADDDVRKAYEEKRIAKDAHVLRLVLFHHPVTGNDKIKDDAFLEKLRKAEYELCLHGHVHEDRADLVGYLHPTRKLHVIGAGSFGAGAADRPPSTPKLYNLVEIAPDHTSVRVYTRAMPKEGGAFKGWAVWPGEKKHEMRDFYDIRFGENSGEEH